MKKTPWVILFGIGITLIAFLRWYNETLSLWACSKDQRLYDFKKKFDTMPKRKQRWYIRLMSPNTINLVSEALYTEDDEQEAISDI